jgi:transcriptional regulator with XRE-family HTH domain
MLTYADPIVTNRLRELRRSQGLPLYGLAVKASVSPTIASIVERFDYRPGVKAGVRLAQALGVSETDIWPEQSPETNA